MKNLLACAKLCQLSYADPTTVAVTLKEWGFETCYLGNIFNTDTQFFIGVYKLVAFVVFRGTEMKLSDLHTDFMCSKVPIAGWGSVHKGFHEATNSAFLEVAREIYRPDFPPVDKFIFTGHSLGGAIAELFVGARLRGNEPTHGLYTFGAPRVGDADYQKAFDRYVRGPQKIPHPSFRLHVHRAINNRDLVPALPPEWLGFASGQHQVWYYKNGWMTAYAKEPNDGPNDHPIAEYIQMIERFCTYFPTAK